MDEGESTGHKDFPVYFGEWLKRRRRSLDLTQDELAQRAGCSVFALRKIESGERRPSKQLAGLLAQALEVDPQDQAVFVRVARGELNLERLHPAAVSSREGALPGGSASAEPAPSPGVPGAAPVPQAPPLPMPTTPLIGRERELAALERFFSDRTCRLLTLTGPGGIGKTRLAIEFATCQDFLFSGGSYYVPLATIDSCEYIIPAIAAAVGFSFSGPGDAREQFFNHLAGHTPGQTLLVLDNLEHLLPEPATGRCKTCGAKAGTPSILDLISEILQRLPRVTILATSRERLSLRGEWAYELHGLPVPPQEYTGRVEAYPAAALFLESARRTRGDYEAGGAQEAVLAQICQMLEGVPLAIELAAAWVGVLSIGEIAGEIQSNIDFLTTSLRDVPERHRSLRASFDHSWRLLPEEERQALMRLSVFQGGGDRAGLERVAGAGLPVLAALVSKSLIRYSPGGRYDMHEGIRQFAFAHFREDPGCLETRDRHAQYYLTFLKEREAALMSARRPDAFRELKEEWENLHQAWEWAIGREMFLLAGDAARSLAWFLETQGLHDEGIQEFELLVQALETGDPGEDRQRGLGRALAQQGLLLFHKGHFRQACLCMDRSLELLRPFGEPCLLVDSLANLGIMRQLNGEIDRAQALLSEGLACAQACGDPWFTAYADFNLGYNASLQGRYEKGYRQMLDGLAVWRAQGEPRAITLGLNFISPTAIQLGRHAEAEAFLEESLNLCAQLGDRWGMGTAYRYLGQAKLAQGRGREAQALLRQSLEIFTECVVGWDIAHSLILLGEADLVLGDKVQARQSFRDGLRIASEAGAISFVLEALAGWAELESQGGDEDLAFRLAWAVLQDPAGSHETREKARFLRSVLEAPYAPEQARAMRQRADGAAVEALVQEVLETEPRG